MTINGGIFVIVQVEQFNCHCFKYIFFIILLVLETSLSSFCFAAFSFEKKLFSHNYINYACFSRLYMEEEETCRLHCEKPFDMGWYVIWGEAFAEMRRGGLA